ncbi:hypothetical protein GCM10009547_15970 [Sporichthya brevicatena]|uniref:Uncharacterized protein n=1 Tax=Sporichthya brevicatena TaxID=171442 RepID=A0ABN1GN13_9ACTN
MSTAQPFDHFPDSTLTGTYTPDLGEFLNEHPRLGVNLQSMYAYGGGRAEDGSLFVVHRKFLASMTGGLTVMSSQSGSMQMLPGTPYSARGEVRRVRTPEEFRWFEPLMQRIPEDLRLPGEQPLDLTVTNDTLRWDEGNLLNLNGSICATGVKLYCSLEKAGMLYTSQPYAVEGVIDGRRMQGTIFLDAIYFRPHGAEWKETEFYTDRQVFWNLYANQLQDGTTQFGHLVRCTNGMNLVCMVEGDRVIASTDQMEAAFSLDDDGNIDRGEYRVDDIEIAFSGVPDGRMEGHSKARWGGYKSQAGEVRIKGDDRPVKVGFSWMEFFSDRIRSEGLAR